MLEGLLGVRLMLFIGDTVPLPAPREVTDALTRLEVTHDADGSDGFQMTFSVSKLPGFDYGLLVSGAVAPFRRVVIAMAFGALPEVLMDGIITHQQLQPSNDPGETRLTVSGKDVSVMLDLREENRKFENQPDALIVTTILAAYAQYGLIPEVTPTTDVPLEIERIPRQQETDLQFLQRLARRNGFVFYIEPQAFGVNTAHWGPENRLTLPQPALTMNMGSYTNVKDIQFSNDALGPVGTEGTFVEPFTKTAIPIPPLPSLKIPPLAALPASPRRTVLLRDTANENPASAAVSALAAATNSPDPVTAQGTIDAVRYGRALRARGLVGVRGVGWSYNGNYYVRRVTHTVEEGQYTQSFSLSREGTGALLPVVVP